MLLHLVSTLLCFIVATAHAGTYYIESTHGTSIRIHNDGRVDLTRNKGSLEKFEIEFAGYDKDGNKEYYVKSVANGRYLSVPSHYTLTTTDNYLQMVKLYDGTDVSPVKFQLHLVGTYYPPRISIIQPSWQWYLIAESETKLDIKYSPDKVPDEVPSSATFTLVSATEMKSYNPVVYNIKSAHGTMISTNRVSYSTYLTDFAPVASQFMIKYLHNSSSGKVYAIKLVGSEKYLSVRGSGKWVNVIYQNFVGSWEKFFIKFEAHNKAAYFKSRKWKNYLRAPEGNGVPLNTATSRNSWEKFDLIANHLQF